MFYTTKAVRSVSKQGHIQPHFHSKARSLSRTVKWRILKQIYYTIVTAKDKQYFRAACLDNNTSLNLFSIQFDIKSLKESKCITPVHHISIQNLICANMLSKCGVYRTNKIIKLHKQYYCLNIW